MVGTFIPVIFLPIRVTCSIYGANGWRPIAPIEKRFSLYCNDADFSQYSDFKRYTKEQFSEQDQFKLSQCFKMLVDRGCYVLLTNSNHPLVYEYYSDFEIRCIDTKRHISCKGGARTGEDIIVIGYDV